MCVCVCKCGGGEGEATVWVGGWVGVISVEKCSLMCFFVMCVFMFMYVDV